MRNSVIPVYAIGQHCTDREANEFKVASFDETACTRVEFQEKHRHEFFEIIWLKHGSGIHQIDLRDHPYRGSVMFILSPGQIHRITQSTRSEGYVVRFSAALFNNEESVVNTLLDTFLSEVDQGCPTIPVPRHIRPQLEELFSALIEESQAQQTDSPDIFGSYLRILLTLLNRLRRQRQCNSVVARDPQSALFRDFRIALEKNYGTERSVPGYAKLLNVKPRTLNRITKTFGNKSVGEMIQDRILLEAKRRLFHGTGSVKEICYSLGFTDPAYFTRFFRKHTRLSPQEFRHRYFNRQVPGLGSLSRRSRSRK